MIAGTTRVVVVIGDPIEHTRSPAMLNAAFAATGLDFVMVPLRVAPADFALAVHGLGAAGVVGASVTLPHKPAAARVCTQLTPEAEAIGAVNCIAFAADGAIVGDNTDGRGFVAALAAEAPAAIAAGTRTVILGAGGAAIAVAAALRDAGVKAIILARRPTSLAVTPWTTDTIADAFELADLVVDATPVGLDPAAEPAFVDALPLDRLRTHAVVASLVYHRRTLLLNRALARGHVIVDGAGMLVHQGALAFARWTGRVAPVDVMIETLRARQ